MNRGIAHVASLLASDGQIELGYSRRRSMGVLLGLLAMTCLALPSAANQFPDIEMQSQGTAACICDPGGVSMVVQLVSGSGGSYSWAKASGPAAGVLTFNAGSVAAPPGGDSKNVVASVPGTYTVAITYTSGALADTVVSAPFSIIEVDLDHDLWWFDGEDPGGLYHTCGTLTAQGISTGLLLEGYCRSR